MNKFIGVRNGKIETVSSVFFMQDGLQVLPLPKELEQIANNILMQNYKVINGEIVNLQAQKPINELKVAFINNWKQRCGISTYSESVIAELINKIKNYKLFIEENEYPTGDNNILNQIKIPDENIITCWKRGQNLTQLINEIKNYNPDVILIQHEWGIFPDLKYWLSLLTQLSSYRIIVVMHSVFYHLDKLIAEAGMKEVIVHLDGAKQVLKEVKQISANVSVIPHGCDVPKTDGKLWNFYRTRNTFVQMGFGYSYKGWFQSLETTAILKEKYPDVFFTGIISESPFNATEHQKYYEQLMKLIEKLNIEENVGFIRGFQSDEVINSILRCNTAAIYPYVTHPEHQVFGASGAARRSMTFQLPIVSSSIAHFSDLPTVKADNPKDMAAALSKFFDSPTEEKKQIELQNQYLLENSWSKIAEKYLQVIVGN